ncbi:MAG: pyridoxal phosphate-dependent aminotransferase [Rhodospirillales bacterium]|nr:pyridoxal phosphate-dependent aminotransferase [Rhodospirillales bacterium]
MVKRLRNVPGFSIDRVAAAAAGDPEVLRLENLDSDIRPPAAALQATHQAIDQDDANSYLPFHGQDDTRATATAHVSRLSGVSYDSDRQCVITAGGTAGYMNALLATIEEGDEVILTDPTYAGMIYRVRLAGGTPKLVPFRQIEGVWRLDLDALQKVVTERTRMVFIMNPSMPSGAVLNGDEWNAIAKICRESNAWLLYNAAMERILFDGMKYLHPASFPGMAERTITVGSVAKEYSMIGWRVGWVVGPAPVMDDIRRVSIYNVVSPVGLTQSAAAAALRTPDSYLESAVAEWQRRRDLVLAELEGIPVMRPQGGYSLLLNTGRMGFKSFEASERLLEHGKIAATPMRDWGEENSDQFVRLVFSNEPLERLRGIRARVDAALGR